MHGYVTGITKIAFDKTEVLLTIGSECISKTQ